MGTKIFVAPLAALVLFFSAGACGKSADKPTADRVSTSGAVTPTASTAARPSTGTTTSGTSTPGAGTAFDFCTLLTADEAKGAVRGPLRPGKSKGELRPTGLTGSCQYFGTDNPVGLAATIVQVILLGTKIPRATFDSEIVGDAATGAVITGLGEYARALPGIITVFDHGVVVALEVVDHSVPVDRTKITALVRAALSRADKIT